MVTVAGELRLIEWMEIRPIVGIAYVCNATDSDGSTSVAPCERFAQFYVRLGKVSFRLCEKHVHELHAKIVVALSEVMGAKMPDEAEPHYHWNGGS